MKKFFATILSIAMLTSFTACSKTVSEEDIIAITEQTNVLSSTELTAAEDLVATGTNEEVGFQLDLPDVGEEIAVITTNVGVIKVRFFPEIAPKAVYNFKMLASEGYYDGLTFHRTIADFIIQGGDPNGDGTGGESIWGETFENEYSDELLNITGSLAMANSGEDTNGSQFYFNINTTEFSLDYYKMIYEDYYLPDTAYFEYTYGYAPMNTDLVTEAVVELYEENGGNISLDGSFNESGYTVFGQVFEGLDIVESISQVETDDSSAPLTEITIESVEIVIYEG